jgi:hypothetical protein
MYSIRKLEGINSEVFLSMRNSQMNIHLENVGPKLLDNIFIFYDAQFGSDWIDREGGE